MKFKKTLALILALAMSVCMLAACGSSDSSSSSDSSEDSSASASDEKITLNVFAAASMTETLTELADAYMEENPNVEIVLTLDSSGTLETQILEGAECDIFISAAQKQMNELDASCDADVNPDGNDYILEDSRFDFLENKVDLTVAEGNPKNINSFDDLKAGLSDGSIMLAMGNSDVPVGQYTQKILTYLGLDEASLAASGNITYGTNVKEVTTQVSEATVDCGIIYATDAYSAGLTVVAEATADMCGQVIYPAAILKQSANADAAQNFLDYLTSDDADDVFANVGFTPIND